MAQAREAAGELAKRNDSLKRGSVARSPGIGKAKLAEIGVAEETDRAQAAGQVQRRGGKRRGKIIAQDAGNVKSKLAEIGVDSKRLAEWRKLAAAGPEAVEKAIQTQLAF
jgi:hypothetical protein